MGESSSVDRRVTRRGERTKRWVFGGGETQLPMVSSGSPSSEQELVCTGRSTIYENSQLNPN